MSHDQTTETADGHASPTARAQAQLAAALDLDAETNPNALETARLYVMSLEQIRLEHLTGIVERAKANAVANAEKEA